MRNPRAPGRIVRAEHVEAAAVPGPPDPATRDARFGELDAAILEDDRAMRERLRRQLRKKKGARR